MSTILSGSLRKALTPRQQQRSSSAAVRQRVRATAVIAIGLAPPVSERRGRGFELPTEFLRQAAGAGHVDDPLPELGRVRS
jgi:hypothetical protein